MSVTVIQYILSRLRQLGVTDFFGVPGDFAFPINDAICEDKSLRFIGSCNELNAAYAADGYARIKGLAAINTTYGPGELGALPAVAGAYAEHVPIFHLTGQPSRATQKSRAIVHHTLGNGEFNLFHDMTAPAVCARSNITPENCIAETERLIDAALYHRRPVYMALPSDVVNQPVVGTRPIKTEPKSDPAALENAVKAIAESIGSAKSACILPGIFIARLGLCAEATDLVERSGLPFATMMMDKTVLDETHPSYIGMYVGAWSDEAVRSFVESADCILAIGTLASDFNTGAFTSKLDRAKVIQVMHHAVRVGDVLYEHVEMHDLLKALASKLPKRTDIHGPNPPSPAESSMLVSPGQEGGDNITATGLYSRLSGFLRRNDILIAETGTASLGFTHTPMPQGATMHNQTLWGAIGWATPAAFGAALAAPERRTILVTGEGAHQLTAQEVSQFHRAGLKPIIFVLNNRGYLIERLLCKNPEIYYNDLAQWQYHLLPKALGCEGWYTAKVTNNAEFDAALARAQSCGSGAYIEVITDKYAAPPMALKMHQSTKTLYQS